jgi:arylsulfatase A-like enzyme
MQHKLLIASMNLIKNMNMKRFFILITVFLSGLFYQSCSNSKEQKMNVLFIVVDDLNDWVGCFGGNPQIKTPNMDRLAEQGGMVFMNAQAPATVCGPSRSAFLTGLRPSTTGVYTNRQNLRYSEKASLVPTIPQYFSKNGYTSISTGKIFHKHPDIDVRDQGQWAFDVWKEEQGGQIINKKDLPLNGLPDYPIKGTRMDWGPTITGREKTKDWQSAEWIAEKLKDDHDKPFFMMLGISKPHLSWYVPQEYFDLYNLDSIDAPLYLEDDLDDIITPEGEQKFQPSLEFLTIKENNKIKEAARAYMACVSYADDCVGLALESLQNSKYKDNTIVIVIGDHGWHLGEKMVYRKNKSWEEDCRAPLIIYSPEMKEPGIRSQTVNLLDLYPTLAEMCNLPKPEHCEGKSLVPLMNNANLAWDPALTTISYMNHSVRSEEFRYIIYDDGTEELYDHIKDPTEWLNLISDTAYKNVISEMRKYLPEENALPSITDAEVLGQQ